jgi:excisionase family DNA binding protein
MENTVSSPYLTRPEAAKFLGVSPAMLDKLMRQNELVIVRIGTRIMFDVADLNAFAKSCKTKSAFRSIAEAGKNDN